MFVVFIVLFKMFISSVYSVTAIAMPLSISLEHHEFATSMTESVGFLCEGALWHPV